MNDDGKAPLSVLILKTCLSPRTSAKGRADDIVETDDNVYVFEFKKDKSATEALKQIEDMGYAKPYVADKRWIYKIGVNFDSGERNITEWIVI